MPGLSRCPSPTTFLLCTSSCLSPSSDIPRASLLLHPPGWCWGPGLCQLGQKEARPLPYTAQADSVPSLSFQVGPPGAAGSRTCRFQQWLSLGVTHLQWEGELYWVWLPAHVSVHVCVRACIQWSWLQEVIVRWGSDLGQYLCFVCWALTSHH